MALNNVLTVICDAKFADLVSVGVYARSSVMTVGQALASSDDNTPAVWLVGGNAVIIESTLGESIGLWGPLLAPQLKKVAVTAGFSDSSQTYFWTIDTPAGTVRQLLVSGGKVVNNSGEPAPEEAGLPTLDEATLLELLQRHTGVVLNSDDTAIPVDLGKLASQMTTHTPQPADNWFSGEDLPPDVAGDFDKLAKLGVDFINDLLTQQGGFSPFGFGVKSDDDLEVAVLHDRDPNDTPDAELDAMIDVIRPKSDGYRAIGLFTDISLTSSGKPTEAIRICLEHKGGHSIQLLLPYEMKGFRKKKPQISIAGTADWLPRLWV